MKEKEDILSIFKSQNLETVPLTDADWINIESKYTKALFYRWSYNRMNVYYLGLILLSFFGTLTIGVDYYFTKQRILDENNYGLHGQNFSQNEPKLENSTILKNKEQERINILKSSAKDEKPNHEIFQEGQKQTTKLNEPKVVKKENLDKKSETINLDSTIKENPKKVDIFNTQVPNTKDIKDTLKKEIPVIIYVQDTILKIDSTKVSARKLRKMND